MKKVFKKIKITSNKKDSPTDRQERLPGWQQSRMKSGRALILGAGALGNEVVKNLALMGLDYMLIADFDIVEDSNLSRTVMFCKADAKKKRSKSRILAKRSMSLNVQPKSFAQSFHGDVVWGLGTGVFRRVDVVIGCLDNVEARVSANKNCLLTGTPYIDGGIYGLSGNVTSINPPLTACWECTISSEQLALSNDRYDSCSRLMKIDISSGRLPSIQIASTIIAGFQAQEATKIIQGAPWASGTKLWYSAIGGIPSLDIVKILPKPDCWCNNYSSHLEPIEIELSPQRHSLNDLLICLNSLGYENPIVRFADALVLEKQCHNCGHNTDVLKPAFSLTTETLLCQSCLATGDQIELLYAETTCADEFSKCKIPDLFHRILKMSLSDLGFPILAWIEIESQSGPMTNFFIELTGDASLVMGALYNVHKL